MQRALVLSFVFALACDKSAATTQPCEPATSDAAPASASASGSAALDKSIRDAAMSAPAVTLMKIRVDESGAVVKQSVYHGDASAMPAAVRELTDRTFPGSKQVKYETEVYADIGQVFEIELETADGKLCEVASKPDGTLVYTECRLDPRELPEPVVARVDATIAGGKVVEAEQKQGPEIDEYSVEIEFEGRQFYLRVKPDGTLIAKLLRVPAIVELPLQ